MVSESIQTVVKARERAKIERDWRFNRRLRAFDETQAETKHHAYIIKFPHNRFTLSDTQTERMLMVSMETVEYELVEHQNGLRVGRYRLGNVAIHRSTR